MACFDDFEMGPEPYENDLEELGNREAWEDSLAERNSMEEGETAVITVDESEVTWANELLKRDTQASGYGPDEVITTWHARFEDGVEADIKLVNSESGPYLDAVLFEDGCEIQCIEPAFETVEGEYLFSGYTVRIAVEAEPDAEYLLVMLEKAELEEAR